MDEGRRAKMAWLCRYRDSLKRQERLKADIAEVRGRSVGMVQNWNIRTGPTGSYTDRVADTAQQIDRLERKLQQEQQRGQEIAAEIIITAYTLPMKYAEVLCCLYLDGLTFAQTANKTGLAATTVQSYKKKAIAALALPVQQQSDIE